MQASAATQLAPSESHATPLFVAADAIGRVLAWPEMIDRLRKSYSVPHTEQASPPRVVARGGGAWVRALAAVPPGSRFMGAKVFGFGRAKSVSYLIALFEQDTGALAALIDANLVTGYRTAATSAVAVDRIAPPGLAVIAVLGSGLEAKMHLRAIATVRPLREVRVHSPTAKNREAFAALFTQELGVPCSAVASAREAVDGASIVVAAARSHDETPILKGEWLRDGMTVVSIGSTLPDQREIDARVVDACDLIICDMVEEVVHETGDMIAAKQAGVAFEPKLMSLNELLSSPSAGERLRAARLPMFKSVGAAIQDVVVAELAFENAVAAGLVRPLGAKFVMKQT
jgi:alanine dehydrogenase